MPTMVKYLLSSSKVAEQPPRRADTTAAPTFMLLSNGVLKKSLSKKLIKLPLAEA